MEYSLNGSGIGSIRGLAQRLGPERARGYLARIEADHATGASSELDLVMAMIDFAEEEPDEVAGDEYVDLFEAPDLLETLRERGGRRNSALSEIAEGVSYALEQLELRGTRTMIGRCVLEERDAWIEMHLAVQSLTLRAEVVDGDRVGAGVQVSAKWTGDVLEVDLFPRIYRVVCTNGILERVRTEDRRRYDDRHDAMLRSWVNAGVQRHLTDKASLEASVVRLRRAATQKVTGETYLSAAIKEFGVPISAATHQAVLSEFARDPSGSRWAMINATTSRARLALSLEEALRLERFGALMTGFEGVSG
jgi:hypothetical protein